MRNNNSLLHIALAIVAMAALMPATLRAQSDPKATVAALDTIITRYGNNMREVGPYVDRVFEKHRKNPSVAVGIAKAYYSYVVPLSYDPYKNVAQNPQYHNRDSANSLKYVRIALSIDPLYVPAMVHAGDLYYTESNIDEAFAWYRRAIDANPSDPRGYLAYAKLATNLDRIDDAIGILTRLQQANPDYPVQRDMGRAYYRRANVKLATQCYDQVALDSLDYYDMVAYAFCAFYSDSLSRVERSLQVVERGLADYPRSATLNRIGLYDCYRLERHEDALAYGSRLFNASDNFEPRLEDYTYYAGAYAGLGQYDRAIEMYYQAIDMPNATEQIRQRCLDAIMGLHQQSGDYATAISMQRTKISDLEKKGQPVTDAYKTLYTMCLHRAIADSASAARQIESYMQADVVLAEMERKLPTSELTNTMYERFRIASVMDQLSDDTDMKRRYANSVLRAKETFDYIALLPNFTSSDLQRLNSTFDYMAYYYTQIDRNHRLIRSYSERMVRLDPTNQSARNILGLR